MTLCDVGLAGSLSAARMTVNYKCLGLWLDSRSQFERGDKDIEVDHWLSSIEFSDYSVIPASNQSFTQFSWSQLRSSGLWRIIVLEAKHLLLALETIEVRI